MTLRFLCLLFIPLGLSMQAGAVEKDVRSWLQEMVDSTHSLNYEGIFVYLHGNQLESMQVVHTVDEDGERERLFSLNGAAREVVRDNASVTCVAPDARSVSISRSAVGSGFRSVFGMDLNALSNYYRFNLLDSSRVAGRDTQLVAISPVDDYRYGYRIYLDRQNALPLKTELLNANAEAVSQIMFTSIQVKQGSEKLNLADDSMEGREHYAWEQRKPMRRLKGTESTEWVFEKLPAGYQLKLQAWRPATEKQPEVGHFVLSDGLASLSVYVEKVEQGDGLEGSSNMGAVNAFGKRLNDYLVTAVGSVPAVTVKSVANAIRRVAVQ